MPGRKPVRPTQTLERKTVMMPSRADALVETGPAHFTARKGLQAMPVSGILEVYNYGRHRPGLIPLWVGEGDLATPAFICEAATRSLAAGETFYGPNRGAPELRAAVAAYMTRVYGNFAGAPFSPERFFVTAGGMHALQIAMQLVAGNGDQVLVPTPAWPNFRGAAALSGATVVEVPMRFVEAGASGGRWHLDPRDLEAAIGPVTRAIVVNSPSNPTGWTATREELAEVLTLARRHGLWIIADEIYGRLVFEGERAASFHDVMRGDDQVVFVQTLSKNWAMTGWRVGWLEAPADLGQTIESLIQYSTSGVPLFCQRAATAAIERGESFLAHQLTRIKGNWQRLAGALAGTNRLRFAAPSGAFYLFLGLAGGGDSRQLALRLIDEANIGLAPGFTFGEAGEGFLRLCFARKPEDIDEAAQRLRRWLDGGGG
jgi:aspartate/methionine/tyrosine aminotransferase